MVPCYNCELQAVRVASTLDGFLSTFKDSSASSSWNIEQILFIDNHSKDKTVAELKKTITHFKHKELFHVAQNEHNYGLGGSHKSVFCYALAHNIDYVAVVHGDNQADARELLRLIEVSQQNNGATVLGSRFSPDSRRINYSQTRSWGNMALNRVYSLLLGREIHDLGSGLNIFNMAGFQNKIFLHFDDQFTFNMDLLIYLVNSSHPPCFTPISWKTEDEVSNALSWKVGARALDKIIKWAIWGQKIWRSPEKSQRYIFKIVQ